ncbi:TIGR03086 family metal-binding protein [Streptomyces sp. NPDC048172]|uniref:TIGR03086 family metal-binding protein n=1 Tax=Streptomyces sp. NPDC048172 TaxID=3365505 RepID=UPI00371FD920
MKVSREKESVVIDLKPACRRMSEVVEGVGDGQLDGPTPCAEYDVSALIGHVAQVARGFAAVARKEEAGDGPLSAPPEEGWREALAKELGALGEAWDDPAAWEGESGGAGVELPNALWGRITLTELVVHGWDLARATGQPFGLPEETVHACYAHVAEFVPNAPLPELWGTPVEVPENAPLLDRLLGITGRDVQRPNAAA